MQDADLFGLREIVKVPLNLELAATPEMIALALASKPDMAMIVPEGRDEITTEGGLDVTGDSHRLTELVQTLGGAGIPVSAFIDADMQQIDAAKACGFSVCEIHTGAFAEAVIDNDFLLEHQTVQEELHRICKATEHILEQGMQCNAGHGLTHHNVGCIASIQGISELHIGHSIVSQSIFVGMRQSVEEMKDRIVESAQ